MKTPKTIVLQITDDDIACAVCANRRRCVLAQAVNRQLQLNGRGYVKIDANGAAYTFNGFRYCWQLPKEAVLYLRRFDETGEKSGLIAARAAVTPQHFRLRHIKTAKIPPPASRARKDQINARRNRIAAEERAQGVAPRKIYRRYTGV